MKSYILYTIDACGTKCFFWLDGIHNETKAVHEAIRRLYSFKHVVQAYVKEYVGKQERLVYSFNNQQVKE